MSQGKVQKVGEVIKLTKQPPQNKVFPLQTTKVRLAITYVLEVLCSVLSSGEFIRNARPQHLKVALNLRNDLFGICCPRFFCQFGRLLLLRRLDNLFHSSHIWPAGQLALSAFAH